MEHMHKNVLLGLGDVNNPALTLSGDPQAGYTLTINQDRPQTPADRTDDVTVTYVFDPTTHQITVTIDDGATQIQDTLADNLMSVDITLGAGGVWVNNMSMKYDPTDPAVDQTNNPELEIRNQYFFPLSQSLS
jgi:hypothetical protein